jgi:hypothetical protein
MMLWATSNWPAATAAAALDMLLLMSAMTDSARVGEVDIVWIEEEESYAAVAVRS